MPKKLFYETVSPLLKSILELLMKEDIFKVFRLVGGTALSLQLGHRKSVDIDLFTEAEYGSVDFDPVCLRGRYWEIIKLDILDALQSIG